MKQISSRLGLVSFVTGTCLSFVLIGPSASAQVKEKPSIQDPDEYAVYSAILNSQHDSSKWQQLIINGETINKKEKVCIGFIGGITFSGAKRPETKSDTASDFDAKYAKPRLLERRLDVKIPYILVGNDKLQAIFTVNADGRANSNAWAQFYKQYPGSSGIVAFSQVGFNLKKDQALVWAVHQSGFVGGTGGFFVLSKNSGVWKVEKQVMIWIS